MRTGNNGRIAIYWTQTELDGLEAAPLADVSVGSTWSWKGPFLDFATAGQLGIEYSASERRAPDQPLSATAQAMDPGISVWARIELSNGAQRFVADIVRINGEDRSLLIFENGCPAREQEFWVNSVSRLAKTAGHVQQDANVVAFPSRVAAVAVGAARPRQIAGIAAE